MIIRREDLAATDFGDEVTGERPAHVTPGDVLRHEFMEPLGLSTRAVARDMGVPVTRITEILNAERAVTAETGSASAAGSAFRRSSGSGSRPHTTWKSHARPWAGPHDHRLARIPEAGWAHRLVFRFRDGDAHDVEIVDYH